MAKRPSILLKLKHIKTDEDEDTKKVIFVLLDADKDIKLTVKGRELAESLGFEFPGTEFKLTVQEVAQTTLEVAK